MMMIDDDTATVQLHSTGIWITENFTNEHYFFKLSSDWLC